MAIDDGMYEYVYFYYINKKPKIKNMSSSFAINEIKAFTKEILCLTYKKKRIAKH